jgi:hypothetical protein
MPYGSKSVVRPWSVPSALIAIPVFLIAIPVFLVACGDDSMPARDAAVPYDAPIADSGAIADAGGSDAGGTDAGIDAGACLEPFAPCDEGGAPCCGEAVCFRGMCSPPLGGTR